MAKQTIRWLSEIEPHCYPAAASYLSLIFEPKRAKGFVRELRKAPITEFKAKDIFRASKLSLLGVSNGHVQRDRQKIAAREKLSPLLLVRSSPLDLVIIADGYHRLCAVYAVDEDSVIPCKIV